MLVILRERDISPEGVFEPSEKPQEIPDARAKILIAHPKGNPAAVRAKDEDAKKG